VNHLSDSVLTHLLGKLPYNGSVPQFFFFERMVIKHHFSLGIVNLALKSATQAYVCNSPLSESG